MTISATSLTSTTSTSTTATSTATSSDFDTFLQMLTVQLKNQDPLNPMESNDFAVQLATFSGVEQQVRTNELLAELKDQFSILSMSQLSGWVGRDALTESDVWYDGSAITLLPEGDPLADNLVLVVTDSNGDVVSRETVPVDSTEYTWLGADATGEPLAEGLYSLSLESRIGTEVISTDPIESYAEIIEARLDGDEITLVLKGGIEIAASDVKSLRN